MTQHDPGGKSLFPLPDGVVGSAVITENGLCRWVLTREFTNADPDQPNWLWVGLNPSTAKPDMDDPTIRVEWNLTIRSMADSATSKGRYPSYTKMNVLPYRLTDPASLGSLMTGSAFDAGPERDAHIIRMQSLAATNMLAVLEQAQKSDRVVLAWGKPRSPLVAWQCMQLLSMLRSSYEGVLWCVDLLADGWPAHPLRRKCRLQPYRVNPTLDGKTMEQVLSANIQFLARHVRATA